MSVRDRLRQIHRGLAQPAPETEEADLGKRLDRLRKRPPSKPLEEILGAERVSRGPMDILILERRFPGSQRHGRYLIDEARTIPADAFPLLSGDPALKCFDLQKTVFLDTETTGLAGGAGTYVFLVGLGLFEGDEFVVRQIFLPNLAAERLLLEQVATLVQPAHHLITFNGKAYDVNLLENRFFMHGFESPFEGKGHFDLLYASRLFWKRELSNCALQNLEAKLIDFRRTDDFPSHLIPEAYFDFLRSGDPGVIPSILEHNRLDIITLVALCRLLAQALEGPCREIRVRPQSAARVHELRGNLSGALKILEESVDDPAWILDRSEILFQCGMLHKRLEQPRESLLRFEELLRHSSRPPVEAFEETAKILEHHERNFARALAHVEKALSIYPGFPGLDRRRERLECRLAGKKWY